MSFPRSEAFWSAQSAFWGAVKRQGLAKAAGYSPPVSRAERKAQLWSERGAKYLRAEPRLAATSGQVTVEVDPQLYRDVLATAERLAPAVVAAWDRHLSALAFDAWRKWPVSTGLSKALLQLQYIAAGEQYVGRIVSAAPYTYFIEGHPHRRLLAAPGRRLTLALGRDVLRAGHLDAAEAR